MGHKRSFRIAVKKERNEKEQDYCAIVGVAIACFGLARIMASKMSQQNTSGPVDY
jgi:hypothetical protein